MKDQIKKIAINALVVLFIAQIGAVIGAYEMNKIDNHNAKTTQAVAQTLLKSIPTAQASSLK